MVAATEAVRLLAEREVSSQELVRDCLDRIEEREPELRAWVHLDPDHALAQARARDDEAPKGPLHGLPVGVKDVIDTADMPTAYGSPIYAGRRPARDAACVAWLREQGAVILGKTVTTEFATYRPPVTVNPHDPERTPGGSSSGSAAAVADGMVPLAYGTQTAGSVVRPASYCGVAGFKPRHGWHPTDGIKPLSARLDTLGTLGRTVGDAALLAGFDVADGEPRIAWCPTPWGEPVEEVEQAAQRLGLAELELPAHFAGLADAQETLMAYDVARSLEPEWEQHRDQLSEPMREYLERAHTIRREAAEDGAVLADGCRALLPEVLAKHDAVLVPAATGEAPLRSGGTTGDPLFCRAWTLLGVPVISVPGMTGPAGLPVGVQLVGLDEGALLSAAAWVEAGLA